MEFKEVWLSSIEHLNEFNQISKKYKWWKNLLGIKQVKGTFPKTTIMGLLEFPLVYYAYGKVSITQDKLIFESKKQPEITNKKYKNLHLNLEFEYNLTDVESIELFNIESPRDERFNYPWVNIKFKNQKGFLIANEKKIGEIEIGLKQTELMYEHLRTYINNKL